MARVMKKVGIRLYLVRTHDGQVYRRNRKHLRCTTEAIDKMPQNYEDGEDGFAVSGTADQPTDEAQSNRDLEMSSNIEHNVPSNIVQEEHPRLAEPTQTVTRAGRVIKPSSRYNDFVKL